MVDSVQEDYSKWTVACRREKNCKKRSEYDVSPNGYRHSENDQLGLLTLHGVRYTKIAVDLRNDHKPYEYEKAYAREYEVHVGIKRERGPEILETPIEDRC